MKSRTANRESHRIRELAAEYRRKNFEVVLPTSQSEVPDFLQGTNYIPDIIARSPEENLVIEVKSQRPSNELAGLSRIAETVNAQKGWQFVLVFTNPKDSSATLTLPSAEKAYELLRKSRSIGASNQTQIEASFLFAWAALEAALRLLPQEQKSARLPTSPWTLIRNATMNGHISREDAQALERAFKLRSSLLHAGDAAPPNATDVDLLHRVAKEVIQLSASNEV